MARISSSQTGPADLPQLVERLHAGGAAAVADFSQDELESVIDDLPLALESESIRDHLPALVGRIDRRLERTFRRMIEIARQDEERVALFLFSLRQLHWDGTPTEDEFAWLVQQMSRSLDPAARLAAFERAASLTLHEAQVAILDALGSTSIDAPIRAADARRREAAALPGAEEPAETTETLVRQHEAERQQEMAPEVAPAATRDGPEYAEAPYEATPLVGRDPLGDEEPTPEPPYDASFEEQPPPDDNTATTDPGPIRVFREEAANETTPSEPVYDESQAPAEIWKEAPEPPPDRLTVRTLLRSLEPAPNLAPAKADEPAASGNGAEHTDDEPTVADDDEPTPHVENSLTGEGEAPATADPETTVADESSSPEAAAAAAAPPEPPRDPITVRTLLASLDSVMLSNAPGDEAPAESAVAEESPEVWNESEQAPARVTVMTMLRSLETVRVKMAALEETPPVPVPVDAPGEAPAAVKDTSTPNGGTPVEAPRPKEEPKPWSDIDLKPLSPPDRARRLQKARRALETPELRRGYLAWLFEREKDSFSIVSVRKEILEYAFDRPFFLGFDDATRARLGRWIRERCAADQIAPPAVLAALRRATWAEGEPPQVDEKTRAIVDAATGALSRVPSEERASLFNRDFTAWLFSIREWEDREVLDRYAKDPLPGVSEAVFRALAAMDGLSARFGGTGGLSALEIALGIWDRADSESRSALGKAISEGWSRGLVLDRRAFFDGFWARYQQHEAQRPAILVALASFEKEIEEAQGKTAKAAEPAKPAEPPAKPAASKPWEEDGGPRRDPRPIRPPIAPRADVTRPSVRNPDLDPGVSGRPAPLEAPRKASGFAPPPTEPLPPEKASPPPKAEPAKAPEPPPEASVEEGTDRFFRMMRKNMEVGMRAAAPAEQPVEETPGDDFADAPVPEEGDAVADGVLDEGEAIQDASPPSRSPLPPGGRVPAPPPAGRVPAPPPAGRVPAPPPDRAPPAGRVPAPSPATSTAAAPPTAGRTTLAPAAAPVSPTDTRDDEKVLPNEPLRSLSEYTRFLKALSAGRPIDELLSNHGMDYKQYAACMTAWGRLLQNRPDLALRMGQLLRAAN